MASHVECAKAYDSVGDYQRSADYLERAFESSKNSNGEFDINTASILYQLSQVYEQDLKYADAIKKLEHSGMIFMRLEKQKIGPEQIEQAFINVNKILLKLLNLYF